MACNPGVWSWDYTLRVPYLEVKSLEPIWRWGTRRFHLWVPDLLKSCTMRVQQVRWSHNGQHTTYSINTLCSRTADRRISAVTTPCGALSRLCMKVATGSRGSSTVRSRPCQVAHVPKSKTILAKIKMADILKIAFHRICRRRNHSSSVLTFSHSVYQDISIKTGKHLPTSWQIRWHSDACKLFVDELVIKPFHSEVILL